MSQIEIRPEVIDRLHVLLSGLTRLAGLIESDTSTDAWMADASGNTPHRVLAARAVTDIFYSTQKNGRKAVRYPGIVPSSAEVLEQAILVNQQKDDFLEAVKAWVSPTQRAMGGFVTTLTKQCVSDKVRTGLRQMGASRLHLVQAYRHIPVIDVVPESIGFTWAQHQRAFRAYDKAKAYKDLLSKPDNPVARDDLHRLASLGKRDSLYRVEKVEPHLRANIAYEVDEGDDVKIKRKLVHANLPFFFADFGKLPRHNKPGIPVDGRRSMERCDRKVDDEPYLPSIKAFLSPGSVTAS